MMEQKALRVLYKDLLDFGIMMDDDFLKCDGVRVVNDGLNFILFFFSFMFLYFILNFFFFSLFLT